MIARIWRGFVRAQDSAAYARYVAETGQVASQATPGNRGFLILTRTDGERAEIRTISFWDSLEVIEGFAGADIGRAVFFPEDDAFLVDRDWHVDHFEVADGAAFEGRAAGAGG